MRLLFSESAPNYGSYLSPYQVWAVLEPGETAADAFARGFLPAARDLSRFYLARSIRVDLRRYAPTGRTRYAARRCSDLIAALLPVAAFGFDDRWRHLVHTYLTERHSGTPFTPERFADQLRSRMTTHVLTLTGSNGAPAGLATLYLVGGAMYYAAAAYDLGRLSLGLGGHLMATALTHGQQAECTVAYLGTCYSTGALYKTRFPGMQFFNGYRWSSDRAELQFMLAHQHQLTSTHLLEYGPYLAAFAPPELPWESGATRDVPGPGDPGPAPRPQDARPA